jgi:hypothetical protein
MAVTADSGEGFLWPGGDLSRDLWGKWRGGRGLLIDVGGALN